jgi:hypothetical protein
VLTKMLLSHDINNPKISTKQYNKTVEGDKDVACRPSKSQPCEGGKTLLEHEFEEQLAVYYEGAPERTSLRNDGFDASLWCNINWQCYLQFTSQRWALSW